MLDPASLSEFEKLAEQALGPAPVDAATRAAAQQQLNALSNNLDHVSTIQGVLDNSMNDYAITAASRTLLNLISEHLNSFSDEQRVGIRDYLLNILANKGPKLQQFSVLQLIQLLCRLTKYSWTEEKSPIRDIVVEANKFLKATFSHCMIGMRILNELVTEMNYKSKNRTMTQHRKVAISFRDSCLVEILEVSLSMLNNIATRSIVFDGISEAESLKIEDVLFEQSLNLLQQCFSFDFIGVFPDESLDDVNILQVPATWRERIQGGAPLRLLFNLYRGCTIGKLPIVPDTVAPPPGTSVSTVGMREFRRSPQRAAQVLDCITLMISVRRSLFSTDALRQRFVLHCIRGLSEIIYERYGFDDEDCYHSFCRILPRLKGNFQFSELTHAEGFREFMELAAKFTVSACTGGSWSSNSIHYILLFWLKLVAAIPYAKLDSSSNVSPEDLIKPLMPQIIGAYVQGRVDMLRGEDRDVALEELNDIESLEDQLEALPVLGRFMYESTAQVVISHFDPLFSMYQEAVAAVFAAPAGSVSDTDSRLVALRIIECQLAWLVSIIGALISGAENAAVPQPRLDADLIARVLRLVEQCKLRVGRLTDGLSIQMGHGFAAQSQAVTGSIPMAQLASHPMARLAVPDPRLELALLHFLASFRRAFLSESSGMPSTASSRPQGAASTLLLSGKLDASEVSASGDVSSGSQGNSQLSSQGSLSVPSSSEEGLSQRTQQFLRLFEYMGLGTHVQVVHLILSHIISNLQWWGHREDIIRRSIDVFHQLFSTFSSGKLLLSMDIVRNLLQNHGPEMFPFLTVPANAKHRVSFYMSLGRLVFFEDDSGLFEPFFVGFQRSAQALLQPVQQRVRSDAVRDALAGLARDLRGLVASTHTRFTYGALFDALHPMILDLFVSALGVWADTPAVANAILKFFAELVQRTSQRIQFGSNSPNGVLLFKCAASAITTFAAVALQLPVPHTDAYAQRYKSYAVLARILNRCLVGNFVNFGIFPLYNDPCFEMALDSTLKCLLSIPSSELSAMPKLTQQYMFLFDSVFRSHLDALVVLPPQVFSQVLTTVSEGLDSIDDETAYAAANAIDHFATAFVNQSMKETTLGKGLVAQLQQQPNIFVYLMKILFQIFVFNESAQKTTMVRPLLPTIIAAEIVRPDSFPAFIKDLVKTQPKIYQDRLMDDFVILAGDIYKSLDGQNRDKFAQRLTTFRQTIRNYAIM